MKGFEVVDFFFHLMGRDLPLKIAVSLVCDLKNGTPCQLTLEDRFAVIFNKFGKIVYAGIWGQHDPS